MRITEEETSELVSKIMVEANKLVADLFDIVYNVLEQVAVDFDGIKIVSLPAVRDAMNSAVEAQNGEHVSTES